MSTATTDKPTAKPPTDLIMAGPRLPYHPAIEERFGIDKASWKALVEAIFPNAQKTESVILALSYCRARKLDPFKKAIHIVPIWDKSKGCLVDTVWPGIGELRTTAFRTGEYAGRDKTEWGPMRTEKIGSIEMEYPEWASVTVYRIIKGQRVAFAGPQVWWKETYATQKRNDDTPNEMWQTRVMGQLDKCAEAAALRAAFPEEIGGDYCAEEVRATMPSINTTAVTRAIEPGKSKSDTLADALDTPAPEVEATSEAEADDQGTEQQAEEQPPLMSQVYAEVHAFTELDKLTAWYAELPARRKEFTEPQWAQVRNWYAEQTAALKAGK